ncbi:MAG: YicC family protein [Corallococcus sp.]|nr:YicC family protein [Corallococcus sp.]
MNSMTGYGKSTVSEGGKEITLELKSVNHRFLDIGMKLPRAFLPYEDIVRNAVSNSVKRGHIDVYVNFTFDSGKDNAVVVDYDLAEKYVSAAQSLSEKFNIKNDFQVNALMRVADVICLEHIEDSEEALKSVLLRAVNEAIIQLNIMRQNEGERLKTDLLKRLEIVKELVDGINAFAPEVARVYRRKLEQRMSDILQNIEVDQNKLLNEVAFFSDKSNIDEEITRLYSHIDNAREILDSQEPVGRKLDFLVQELNREANTICSKSNDVTLTNMALALKNEIEKIREQVQNLE